MPLRTRQSDHDRRYKNMLIGRTAESGRIVNAEWIGNTVYGIVKVYFADGTDRLYGSVNAFQPTEEDFRLQETFRAGDRVSVIDREGALIGEQIVSEITKRRVKTDCGRSWTKGGLFAAGNDIYTFPSIIPATAAASAINHRQEPNQ